MVSRMHLIKPSDCVVKLTMDPRFLLVISLKFAYMDFCVLPDIAIYH